MSKIYTVAERELITFFFSPIAYVVLTIFLILCGIVFGMQTFMPGGEASLRQLFDGWMPFILLLTIPTLTMRLMADEFRSGTIETLMTAPLSDAQAILGKYLGTLVFYVLMLATTLFYAVIIGIYGDMDIGMLFASYFGLLLLGSTFIAVGLFFSTVTKNQIIAGLSSIFFLGVFTYLATTLAREIDAKFDFALAGKEINIDLANIVRHASMIDHYRDFVRGLIGFDHMMFFLTVTGLFLFLAVKALESRRWR